MLADGAMALTWVPGTAAGQAPCRSSWHGEKGNFASPRTLPCAGFKPSPGGFGVPGHRAVAPPDRPSQLHGAGGCGGMDSAVSWV